MEEIPCKHCGHKINCHGQNTYTEWTELGIANIIELSCTGAGKKWFSDKNKCKCWNYHPIDNLSWIEQLAQQKGLV